MKAIEIASKEQGHTPSLATTKNNLASVGGSNPRPALRRITVMAVCLQQVQRESPSYFGFGKNKLFYNPHVCTNNNNYF